MTDDQLENLLVGQGESWRAVQPAAPPLSAMTGMPRTGVGRAPWLLPALVAAALVVPVVGTVTLLRRHDPDRAINRSAAAPVAPASPVAPVLVPWAHTPVTAHPAPDRPATRNDGEIPSKGTKQCGAGDFATSSDTARATDATGAPTATGRYVLTLQRIGTEPCAIGNSTPMVNVLDASGHSLGLGGSSLTIGYSGSTVLHPGDVLVVPARICGAGIASLELWLASAPDDAGRMGQPRVRVPIPFPQESTCTSGSSATSHQRVVPAGSLTSLVRSYSVPSRVRSGQRLDYTVTLTNPSATAVSLDPCPAYRQSLINVLELPDKQGATSVEGLNCAAAPPSVPAHSAITFQLRLDTSGVPVGDRRLIWDWLGSAWTDAEGYGQFPTVTVY